MTLAAILQAPTEIAASGHGEHQLHTSEQTLTLTAAVRTAVNNNPYIIQHLSRINVVQADIYQAGRIRNLCLDDQPAQRYSDDRPFSALNLMLSVSDVITPPTLGIGAKMQRSSILRWPQKFLRSLHELSGRTTVMPMPNTRSGQSRDTRGNSTITAGRTVPRCGQFD